MDKVTNVSRFLLRLSSSNELVGIPVAPSRKSRKGARFLFRCERFARKSGEEGRLKSLSNLSHNRSNKFALIRRW